MKTLLPLLLLALLILIDAGDLRAVARWLRERVLDAWVAVVGTPVDAVLSPAEEVVHRCGDCGGELQAVRPGKWQCPRCEDGAGDRLLELLFEGWRQEAQRQAWVNEIERRIQNR